MLNPAYTFLAGAMVGGALAAGVLLLGRGTTAPALPSSLADADAPRRDTARPDGPPSLPSLVPATDPSGDVIAQLRARIANLEAEVANARSADSDGPIEDPVIRDADERDVVAFLPAPPAGMSRLQARLRRVSELSAPDRLEVLVRLLRILADSTVGTEWGEWARRALNRPELDRLLRQDPEHTADGALQEILQAVPLHGDGGVRHRLFRALAGPANRSAAFREFHRRVLSGEPEIDLLREAWNARYLAHYADANSALPLIGAIRSRVLLGDLEPRWRAEGCYALAVLGPMQSNAGSRALADVAANDAHAGVAAFAAALADALKADDLSVVVRHALLARHRGSWE